MKSLQKRAPKNSAVGIKTDGRNTTVVASGPAADFLMGVLGFCAIALTINAIAKS